MRLPHSTVTFASAVVITLGFASLALAATAPQLTDVAARPEQLTFKPFDFAAPDGDKYRHTLPGGVVVYVV